MVYLLWNILEHYVKFDDDYQEFNAHSPAWIFLTCMNLTGVALFGILYCVLRWVHRCRIPCCSHTLLWQLVCSATWIVVRAVHMRLWSLSYDARLDSLFDPSHNTHNVTEDSKREQLRVLASLSAGIGVGINQVLVVIIGGLRSPFAIPTILVLLVDFAVETGVMLEGDSLPASLRLLMTTVVLCWISYRMDVTRRTHFVHITKLKRAKIETELEVDPFSVGNLAAWMGLKEKTTNDRSSIAHQITESLIRDTTVPTTNLRDAFSWQSFSRTRGVATTNKDVAMHRLATPSYRLQSSIDTHLQSLRNTKDVTPAKSVLTDWEIDFSKLEFLQKIGAGGGGQVWKAKLGFGDQLLVAVKQVFSTLQVTQDNMESALGEFSREVSILRKLAHHPNITRLFGICQHHASGSIFFVTEWCGGGALGDVLADPNRRPNGVTDKDDIRAVVEIASQVSAALTYLHGKNILHGDLKPMNVLLSSHAPIGEEGGCRVLLCDFGLATKIGAEAGEDSTRTKHVMRTSIFMAPELLEGGSAYLASATWDRACKTDVYAFGVLMAAVVTGNRPFKDLPKTTNIRATMEVLDRIKAKPHLRPSLPSHCPSRLCELMTRCWADPSARLGMGGVETMVNDMRAVLAGNVSDGGLTPTMQV